MNRTFAFRPIRSARAAGLTLFARLASRALLTASLAALAGCSSPDMKSKPVIDDLLLPETASAGPDGVYNLKGTISYHDDAEPVSLLKLRLVSSGQSLTLGLQAAAKVEDLPITIALTAGAAQTLEYEVSVVSTGGVESAALRQSVTLR